MDAWLQWGYPAGLAELYGCFNHSIGCMFPTMRNSGGPQDEPQDDPQGDSQGDPQDDPQMTPMMIILGVILKVILGVILGVMMVLQKTLAVDRDWEHDAPNHPFFTYK